VAQASCLSHLYKLNAQQLSAKLISYVEKGNREQGTGKEYV